MIVKLGPCGPVAAFEDVPNVAGGAGMEDAAGEVPAAVGAQEIDHRQQDQPRNGGGQNQERSSTAWSGG